MNQAITIAFITLLQAITVAFISGLFNRESRKRKEDQSKIDQHAEMRIKENLLSMKLISANTSLTVATALAVQEGKTNGKMTAALAEAEKAQKEYYEFINSIAHQQLHK